MLTIVNLLGLQKKGSVSTDVSPHKVYLFFNLGVFILRQANRPKSKKRDSVVGLVKGHD